MKLMTRDKLRNANNKVKREFRRLPLISTLHEQIYAKRLADHAGQLPSISLADQIIVNNMMREGAYVTDLATLAIPNTAAALQTAKRLLADAGSYQSEKNKKGIPAAVLNDQPDLVLWGLDDRILDIAENYIQLPIYYLGVEVRQEFADGEAAGVRKWHIDTEDRRMFKIIVYLNDVDVHGGPFEYISKDVTQQAARTLNYGSGLVSDSAMDKVVPTAQWQACTGAENTAVFVDPCNIFHRARPPVSRDRLSITFHYISKYPMEFRSDNTFSDRPYIQERLSERQRNCLL